MIINGGTVTTYSALGLRDETIAGRSPRKN